MKKISEEEAKKQLSAFTRELKDKLQESYRSMCKKLDVSPTFLCFIFEGEKRMPMNLFLKFCDIYKDKLTKEEIKTFFTLSCISSGKMPIETDKLFLEEIDKISEMYMNAIFTRK